MKPSLNQFLSHKTAKLRLLIWLTLIAITLATGLVLWQGGARVQSDILAMLPKVSESPMTQRAMAQVEQQLANRIYLGFISDNEQSAIDAAKTAMAKLKQPSKDGTQVSHRESAFIDISSADMAQAEALNRYYFNHRFQLLTDEQQQLLERGQWQQLTQATLEKLYNAFSYANSDLLSHDPLLLYPDNLIALAPSQQLSVKQGVLLKTIAPKVLNQSPQFAAIVMAKGRDSAFNPNAQQLQLSALTAAFDAVKQQDSDIEIIKAGALFHATAATDNAKKEVSTIGLISLLGVIALVWFAFRSFRPLTIALVTVSSSFLFAVVTTTAVFGELHLLTLVFGTSLIGISIDYCFHYYCERLNHPSHSSDRVIQQIFIAISLALLTSVIAYSAIGLAPFPGMQQVAIFCASGLVGAYLTLLLAYPTLAARPLRDGNRALDYASRYQGFMLSLMPTVPRKRLLLAVGTCMFIIIGFTQLTANDDIRQLQHTPADIQAEEDELRTLLSGGTDNQFLLVTADSEQQVTDELAQLEPLLKQAKQDNLIGNHLSLSRFLPSQSAQERHYQLQGQIYREYLDEILARLGLDPSIKGALVEQYQAAKGNFITADNLLNHAAGESFKPLWLSPQEGETGYGAIVLLGGITQLEALTQHFDALPHVELVDKVGDISTVMGHYRQITLGLLALALLIAGIIFTFRFGVRLAAVVVAVPALSALLTLACLGVSNNPLTLFHALALILVFGIGIDYSLFFAESKQQTRGVMMAVFMSAMSTLLAFGLLAFSQTPAINAFGLTLLLGIGFTFLLSPFIQIFTRKSNDVD
ncbi:conserved hypothetical protein [Shewanella halifaxensis HAW-EB4]|uniref:Membrane transport protein MMPL domain-containing protein n=1 Tax=Shewanella halifaxensis (strain HAW-EB4) TaxID=458817 RepID=B0TPS6_SHEHH|nr:conserved hypothetical protein [Shewanella halifaxensis HAW-EB4]